MRPARSRSSRIGPSSVLAALAVAITNWSSRPAPTQRAPRSLASRPRNSAGTQAGAGRGRDADEEEGPVDHGERDEEPRRPLWSEGERQADHGHHRTVVAHQLDDANDG